MGVLSGKIHTSQGGGAGEKRGAKSFVSEARLPALLPGRAAGPGGPLWLKVRTPFMGSRGPPDRPSSPAERGPGHKAPRRAGWTPRQFPKLGTGGRRGPAGEPITQPRRPGWGLPAHHRPDSRAKVGWARERGTGCEPSGPGPPRGAREGRGRGWS